MDVTAKHGEPFPNPSSAIDRLLKGFILTKATQRDHVRRVELFAKAWIREIVAHIDGILSNFGKVGSV